MACSESEEERAIRGYLLGRSELVSYGESFDYATENYEKMEAAIPPENMERFHLKDAGCEDS